MIRKLLLAFVGAVVAVSLTSVAIAQYVYPIHRVAWETAVARGLIQGDPAYYYGGSATQQEIDHALLTALIEIDRRIEWLGSTSTTTTTVANSSTTTVAPSSTTTTSSSPMVTTTTMSTTTTTLPSSTTTVPVGSGPVYILNETGVVYDGLNISNPDGDCIIIEGSTNITIRNSTIGPCGRWPSVNGKAIYALDSTGINVESVAFVGESRNAVQFDKVDGGRISGNTGVWPLGESFAEDLINVYASSGIAVTNNTLTGGGPSDSGSCIMVGDAGGSDITVTGNVCTNPGQVGIGVAGGTNITVTGNTIYSDSFPWSNVGGYIWNQYPVPCNNITWNNNTIEWYDAGGNRNDFWNGGGC